MSAALFPIPPTNILPYSGEAILYADMFPQAESDVIFAQLITETTWKQEPIKMFGKLVMQPRLTACYGEKSIIYSGIEMPPLPWTNLLLTLKQRVEQIAQVQFNSVLLNYYRDGKDSMGWHRDNEKELGHRPVIASVSFGAERKFALRNYISKMDAVSVSLAHGSLLLMRGDTQHIWEHSVPKVKFAQPRLNLTFRVVQ